MTSRLHDAEAVLQHIAVLGPTRFDDLQGAFMWPSWRLERTLRSLVLSHRLLAVVEPGPYPNRVHYRLPKGSQRRCTAG